MILPKRLQAVATLIELNVRVIDVGCDHAFLDIFLTKKNNNRCIATDINKNALENAKSNISKYNLTDKIQVKLTDGLNGINVLDTDTIVISGMGTHTILDILKKGRLSNTLIISSNNNIELLRSEVIKLGYYIDSEIFLIDRGKPYIVIKFLKGEKKYKRVDIELGPILKTNKEYIKHVISKYNKILDSIKKTKILLRLKYKFKILLLKRRLG